MHRMMRALLSGMIFAAGAFTVSAAAAQEWGGSTYPGPYFMGSPDAPVTIEEYADFQCSNCGAFTRQVLPTLIEQYVGTGQVRFVWHDFTWIGEESRTAAQAARCAAREGLFWGYHDLLYANQRGYNQGNFSTANLNQWAADLGLSAEPFATCLEAGEDLQSIRDDFAAGRAMGITATPFFIVNGERVVGAQSLETFTRIIDAKLAQARPQQSPAGL